MGAQATIETGVDPSGSKWPTNSVRSAVNVLRFLASKRTPVGVSDLARGAAVSKSTAFRLAKTLTECGMVERRDGKYTIGLGSASIGAAYESSASGMALSQLRELATPYVQELYMQSRETIHLAVLDGYEVQYVDKVFGHQAARSPSRIGSRLPASCTAVGKALLANADPDHIERMAPNLRRLTRYSQVVPSLLFNELSQIKRESLAYDHEEAALGLVCVASPIVRPDGRTIAAISLSGPVSRFNMKTASIAVARTASQINDALRIAARRAS
jgi:DNA-binding IclR family transcriptional regulator